MEVSPQCLRFVNDANRLAKCERKQMERTTSESRRTYGGEFLDVPAVCQKYIHAEDPTKLVRCVRKNLVDVEQQASYPECMDFVNDPYKLQKCERKARKYADANSRGRVNF